MSPASPSASPSAGPWRGVLAEPLGEPLIEPLAEPLTKPLGDPPGARFGSRPRHHRSPRARPRRTVRTSLDAALAMAAARAGVSPRAVVGLLLLGVVVAGVLTARLALTHQRAQPVPLRLVATGSTVSSRSTPPTVPSTASSTTPAAAAADVPSSASETTTVLVHVVGQVRHPGVVRLAAGSRVEQALAAAGGPTRRADLVRVNLARPVVDGEQIVVPAPGEPVVGAPQPARPEGSTAEAGGRPVDLNTASLTELDELPGVGPVLAQRILDWRSQNGRFSSVDELGEVSGIGDKVLEKLRPLVQV